MTNGAPRIFHFISISFPTSNLPEQKIGTTETETERTIKKNAKLTTIDRNHEIRHALVHPHSLEIDFVIGAWGAGALGRGNLKREGLGPVLH